MKRHAALFAVALLLAACGGAKQYRPPSDEERTPQGPIDDGVPASGCLLKPIAGPDGALSAAELDAGIKAVFANADTNHDGFLDKAEIQAFNDSKSGSCDRSPLIDWRGSGRVGLTEFGARYRTAFQRADTDGNGILSPEELAARREFRRPPREGMPAPEPGGAQ